MNKRAAAALSLLVISLSACSSQASPEAATPASLAGSATEQSAAASPEGAGSLTPVPTAAAAVKCAAGSDQKAIEACLRKAKPGLGAAYDRIATSAGKKWEAPKVVFFDKKTPAGACQSVDGGVQSSFYCEKTNTVYMMLSISDESTKRYSQRAKASVLAADADRAGVTTKQLKAGFAGAAQVAVLAHEMAHSLLTSNGIAQWYSKQSDKYEVGSSLYDRYGFVHETIADCLTGVALRQAKADGTLRMNAFDLWAARADLAGNNPYEDTTPAASPFKYKNIWGNEVYKGYGGPYVRIKALNKGWTGYANSDPLRMCVQWAAAQKQVPVAPQAK